MVRKYFPAARFASLACGEDFSVDSGMGGSFEVAYSGRTETRHCLRCQDCLTVFFADTEERADLRGECGACAGRIECMGRVDRNRLKKDTIGCPCDARCTHAQGPKCECPCNGANHGTGLLVKVTRDAGPLPRFQVRAKASALRDAQEWRAALECVTAHLNPHVYDRRASVVRRARAMRTHKGRMECMADFLPTALRAAESSEALLFA